MGEAMENVVVSSDNPSALEESHAPVPWREALLAGLPHALVALTYQAAFVATASGLLTVGTSITIVVGVLLALSTAAAMVIAWRRGWPHWSASWFAYAFLLLALSLRGALEQWKLPLGSWRLMLLLPGLYFRLLVSLALAVIILVLGLRHRLRFLLAVLPLVLLLWRPVLEFVPIRSVVELVSWLCAAGVAVLIARAGSVRRGTWMALGLSLGVGLAYTYAQTYHAQFPSSAPAHYHAPPTLLDWWNRLAPGVLAGAVLILEPLLVWRLRVLGRRGGRMGRLGFGVSLAGMILLLAADLMASWWFRQGSGVISLAWGPEVAKSMWIIVPACLAILLCVMGAAILGAGLARAELLVEERTALFVIFVLILMPVIAALPLISGFWDIRTISRIWLYVVGLPWLALGVRLVTRRSTGRLSGTAA
jgi:hypothetical protein